MSGPVAVTESKYSSGKSRCTSEKDKTNCCGNNIFNAVAVS